MCEAELVSEAMEVIHVNHFSLPVLNLVGTKVRVDIGFAEGATVGVNAVEGKKLVLSGVPNICRLFGSFGDKMVVDSVGLFIHCLF